MILFQWEVSIYHFQSTLLLTIEEYVVTLRFSNCRVAFRPAVFAVARICPGESRQLEISSSLRRLSPRLLSPFGGVGFIAWHWGTPNKVNADEAKGIFGHAGRVWALALRPDPPKKGPVPHLPVQWGVQQIPNRQLLKNK